MNAPDVTEKLSALPAVGSSAGLGIKIPESELKQYLAEKKLGKSKVMISQKIAVVLGKGNEDGYDAYKAGKPLPEFDDETSCPVYSAGFKAGYRLASQGKMPQSTWLKLNHKAVYERIKNSERWNA